MAYTIAHVEGIRQRLLELPEIDDARRELNKQEAIRRMAAEVTALRQRGYSMEQIAKILTAEGLQISVATLKSYLTKAKNTSRQKRPRKVGSRTNQPSPQKDVTPSKPSMAAETISPERKVSETPTPARSSSFIPRPDTSDI